MSCKAHPNLAVPTNYKSQDAQLSSCASSNIIIFGQQWLVTGRLIYRSSSAIGTAKAGRHLRILASTSHWSDHASKIWSCACSTWQDGTGGLFSQIDYTLSNTSSKTAMCTLGLLDPSAINQIWNVTRTSAVNSGYTVFTLPSWVTQAGGVAGGGSAGFGGIFNVTAGSPKWAVFAQ